MHGLDTSSNNLRAISKPLKQLNDYVIKGNLQFHTISQTIFV